MIGLLLQVVGIAALAVVGFRLLVGPTRSDEALRRQQLLEESWAVYRASRAIHDETSAALQAMLDEARRARGGA
jgi:hypothetical protein